MGHTFDLCTLVQKLIIISLCNRFIRPSPFSRPLKPSGIAGHVASRTPSRTTDRLLNMATLKVPRSESCVRIRAIDTKTYMSLHTRRFMEPEVTGFDTLNLTSVCFLIEHPTLNKKILFDCGARRDFENYSPVTKERLNAIIKGIRIEADVNEILVAAGISLDRIDSIVWSHWHWDHHGAAENFPESVEIVVGPGFKNNFMPGYPTDPEAPLLDINFESRHVREISFVGSNLKIGQFAAHDVFGDGSFYLLDSPGHAIGHMCGLARTTPTTFVFLGGDICHFSGMYRPSSSLHFPDPIPSEQLDEFFPSPCPCSIFSEQHPFNVADPTEAKSSSFFHVTSSTPSSYFDRHKAMQSIRAMQEFDASEDVLVCIAHDPTLIKILPLLNDQPEEDLSDWKARGYKEKLLWGWLNELPRNGKPGRPMLVNGAWRDGERVTDFLKLVPSR